MYGSLLSPWLGLFFWAPWTALALLAPGWLRRFALVPFAIVAYYLVFQMTHASFLMPEPKTFRIRPH